MVIPTVFYNHGFLLPCKALSASDWFVVIPPYSSMVAIYIVYFGVKKFFVTLLVHRWLTAMKFGMVRRTGA